METGNSVFSFHFYLLSFLGVGTTTTIWNGCNGYRALARAIGRKGKSFILLERGTGARDGYGYWVRVGYEICFGLGEGAIVQFNSMQNLLLLIFLGGGGFEA